MMPCRKMPSGLTFKARFRIDLEIDPKVPVLLCSKLILRRTRIESRPPREQGCGKVTTYIVV